MTCHVHEAEGSAPVLLHRLLCLPLLLAQRLVVNSVFSLEVLSAANPALRRRTTVVYNGVCPVRPRCEQHVATGPAGASVVPRAAVTAQRPSSRDRPCRAARARSNTAVEAMLAARPLVVSATSGLIEADADYASAQLVPPDRPDQLAAALQRVIEDWPAYRTQAVADSRKTSLSQPRLICLGPVPPAFGPCERQRAGRRAPSGRRRTRRPRLPAPDRAPQPAVLDGALDFAEPFLLLACFGCSSIR